MGDSHHFKVLMILTVLVLSSFDIPQSTTAESIEPNFELVLITLAGNRIMESYAFFVKQALRPLGIDVILIAKPYGQYIGDLYHSNQLITFDLAITSFEHSMKVPEFSWMYNSQSTIGREVYQLNQTELQGSLFTDTGVSQVQIDLLLERIDNEPDPIKRKELTDRFSSQYMDSLLYDFPLTTIIDKSAVWMGYGDDGNNETSVVDPTGEQIADNDLWNPQEGLIRSRMLGAKWNPETMPKERNQAAGEDIENCICDPSSLLQLQLLSFNSSKIFVPYLIRLPEAEKLSELMNSPLLEFDTQLNPHPSIAYNFIVEDWTQQGQAESIKNGKITFLINADQKWKFHTFGTGIDYAYTQENHSVDAEDFAFVLDLLKKTPKGTFGVNYQDDLSAVRDWNISTTVFPNDTLTVYLSDYYPNILLHLGKLTPLPAHILSSAVVDADYSSDFLQTPVWNEFVTGKNTSLSGPMTLQDHQAEEYYLFGTRDDFPFPNEWDASQMFDKYPELIGNVSSQYNMSYFAPHLNQTPAQAYYWAFNANSSTLLKPTSQNIENVIFRLMDDDNAAFINFEAGKLDLFHGSNLGEGIVKYMSQDSKYVVKTNDNPKSPIYLVFNLLNEYLRKRDVRFAIASAIDKSQMININDGYAIAHNSPVWRGIDNNPPPEFIGAGEDGSDLTWYSEENAIPYSYEVARDTMRALGYEALEDPNPTGIVDYYPDPPTPFDTPEPNVDFPPLTFIVLVLIVAVNRSRRFRY